MSYSQDSIGNGSLIKEIFVDLHKIIVVGYNDNFLNLLTSRVQGIRKMNAISITMFYI